MKRTTQMLLASAGTGIMLYGLQRALGGRRFRTMPYGYGIKLKRVITVNRPAQELYKYWRNLENLPKLLDNVVSVEILDDTRSRWTLKTPQGIELKWTAEITVDRQNEMVGWRSVGRADLDNAGYVRFERATGGPGTVVRVALQYNPPAGKLGAALSTLLGERPAGQIEEALRKFKQLMEAGEVPTTAEPVETASEDSFPASDAPAWTGTTGPGA